MNALKVKPYFNFEKVLKVLVAMIVSLTYLFLITSVAVAQDNISGTTNNGKQVSVKKEIRPSKMPSGWKIWLTYGNDIQNNALSLTKNTEVIITLDTDKPSVIIVQCMDSTGIIKDIYTREDSVNAGEKKSHRISFTAPTTDQYKISLLNYTNSAITISGRVSYNEKTEEVTPVIINLSKNNLSSSLKIPSSKLMPNAIIIYQTSLGKGFSLKKNDVVQLKLNLNSAKQMEIGYITESGKQKTVYVGNSIKPVAEITIPQTGKYKFFIKNISTQQVQQKNGLLGYTGLK